MGQVFYRKYRSKSFDEVIGQDHITKTLQAAIKKGKISHAYLFTGPRGVGKTSVARILAHEVNNLPYGGESTHLDIIEIDAASNRRIDEIRDLKEKVNITPTSAKYKVYIVDEVHMLTREAFNALLKTLEEPPAHTIFILATTEAHKLPETITSRTQKFNFKPIDRNSNVKHLKEIAKKEKIQIEAGALEVLADHSGGSFRDSLSLLDQLSVNGKISQKDVADFLGIPPQSQIDSLTKAITSYDSVRSLEILEEFKSRGQNPSVIARSLSESLRSHILNNFAPNNVLIVLLQKLLEVPASSMPYEFLELAVLAASAGAAADSPPNEAARPQKLVEKALEAPHKISVEPAKKPVSRAAAELSRESWLKILTQVQAQIPALYSALRLAVPDKDDDTLNLYFEFPLHQKKVNQVKNIYIIGECVERVLGQKLKIECLIDKDSAAKYAQKVTPATIATVDQIPAKDTHELSAISNIFGSVELLESN